MTKESIANLIEAIQTKRQIRCQYDGHERILSPHVYGTKRGSGRFLAAQTAGSSRSGLADTNEENWKCLHIDRVQGEIEFVAAIWETATNHTAGNTCVDDVIAVVDY